STIACNSSGPFTSRFGQCPTKSAETSSAATGLPAHSSLIQRSYIAFAVVICTVYPTVTQTMRPCGDHEYRTQDVHFDAHHRAAEPKVRNAIPVKAPAITWLTRYSPPNSAAKSTVPPPQRAQKPDAPPNWRISTRLDAAINHICQYECEQQFCRECRHQKTPARHHFHHGLRLAGSDNESGCDRRAQPGGELSQPERRRLTEWHAAPQRRG